MDRKNLKNKLIEYTINHTNNLDRHNTGYVLGIISAILMIMCVGTLLMFDNKQVRKIITKNINSDTVENPVEVKTSSTLLTERQLNIKATHANGTVGRLNYISLNRENTIVGLTVTNGFKHTIYLNLHGKGVVIVDNLGHQYNVQPPPDNPDIEIKPGTTFNAELVFSGGIPEGATNLTLITNNQIGSDQASTRRPKMQFDIPFDEEEKFIG
ncbi:hypothetical protein Riv7116_2260 [Rivularia sp. PCC 7116]|uniref:hypothetical protein n=1 Tax=Rivularia sp. PCC 7116 TaxID=373994 RepID=UPI00029F3042|nr:hypothetical protein [Rivularia sp. PCC 7116]AFY54781.1 hypothetical protein Riv7116_2260 [Rivularia sp. PCC 7116]